MCRDGKEFAKNWSTLTLRVKTRAEWDRQIRYYTHWDVLHAQNEISSQSVFKIFTTKRLMKSKQSAWKCADPARTLVLGAKAASKNDRGQSLKCIMKCDFSISWCKVGQEVVVALLPCGDVGWKSPHVACYFTLGLGHHSSHRVVNLFLDALASLYLTHVSNWVSGW